MPAAAKTDPVPETPPEAKPKSGLWLALTNLSIGRTFTKIEDKAADIVHKGETVTLTEEQSHRFLHGHKRAVIRPATETDPPPRLTARELFGKPPPPPFDVRPDPAADPDRTVLGHPLGVSTVDDHPANAPEANDPVVDMGGNPNAAAKDRSAGGA